MDNTIQKRPFHELTSFSINKIEITDSFWKKRQEVNRNISLPMILEKLKKDHHIDNLQIAADLKEGTFLGDFYFDSDLYKWMEGAYYYSKFNLNEDIESELTEIAKIILKAQWSDGYLNSYYSIHFPEKRFTNLLMFHELYCAGHLIEAGIAEKQNTGEETLFNISKKFADLLVRKILDVNLQDTAGHPEIELALIKLYRATNNDDYLKLCKHLIEMRGRIPHLRTYIMRRLINTLETFNEAKEIKMQYFNSHKEENPPKEEVAEFLENLTLKDWITYIRENLNGKVYQLDTPIREAYKPVGHAVRALYFYCGVADLYSEMGDDELLHALELIWLKMVQARMFITGGVGSNKAIEGFEKDFKLSAHTSYSETCAAIANIMWNWRMFLNTGKCKYIELIERLLYNAMLVGQSLDGKRYFYSNPLISDGDHSREEWFKCPCCPTNYIRMIPQLSKYIYAKSEKGLYITQYIGNNANLTLNEDIQLKIKQKSNFPWNGKVEIDISTNKKAHFSLFLRIPEWSEDIQITINDKRIKKPISAGKFISLERDWEQDKILIHFRMKPVLIDADPKRKDIKNKVALSYGPLIYCLEQRDNNFNIFKARIAKKSELIIKKDSQLLDDMIIINGTIKSGEKFSAIPYFAWGNRGANRMVLWMKK